MADTSADPCTASSLSQILAGNFLLCSQKPALVAEGQAMVQSVADNASAAYGADSVTAQVAQQAADASKQAIVTDVNAITQENASMCDGVDLSLLGVGCVTKTIVAIVAVIVVAIVILPYTLPFLLPRR